MVKEEEYLMTNQEILGGLKSAVSRGQSLKQAMMSFYQAGYKKEEIEDAARAYLYLQKGNSEAQVLANKPREEVTSNPQETEKKEQSQKLKKENFVSKVEQNKVPQIGWKAKEHDKKSSTQKVSAYDSERKIRQLKGKTVTITLVAILVFLLGILAAVFLFKAELVEFINGLFG